MQFLYMLLGMGRRSYSSLQQFLKRTGTTQKQFAARVGISQPELSRYLNGKQRLRLELALKIAACADIPVSSLVTERAS